MTLNSSNSIVFLAFLLFPNVAYAVCTANITNLDFGNINILDGGSTDTTAIVSFNCTGETPSKTIQICPNLETGSGGGAAGGRPRYMTSGGNKLSYQMYQDSARTIVWGSKTIPPNPPSLLITTSLAGTGSGNLTLYGRVLSNQQKNKTGKYRSTFSKKDVDFIYGLYTGAPCRLQSGKTLSPSFTTSSNINNSCTLTTSPVAFGTITSLTSPVHASGTVAVTCTVNTNYQVGLDNGQNGTRPTARQMAFGVNRLMYGLYSDSGYSVPWGNTVGTLVSGVGTGEATNFSVYGTVFTQALPNPGIYTDTVIATVTY